MTSFSVMRGQLSNRKQSHIRIANIIPHAPKSQPGGNQIPELPNISRTSNSPNELARTSNQICPCETETIAPRSTQLRQSLRPNCPQIISTRAYCVPTDPSIKETTRHEDLLHGRESLGKRSNSQRREELGRRGEIEEKGRGRVESRYLAEFLESQKSDLLREANADRDHGRRGERRVVLSCGQHGTNGAGVARPAQPTPRSRTTRAT